MPTTCKLIAKNVLGSDTASVTFSSIPATYTDLWLVMSARSDRSGDINDFINVSFNGSTSNFTGRYLQGNGSSASSNTNVPRLIGYMTASNSTASTFGSSEAYIPNYAGSTNKSFSVSAVNETNGSVAIIILCANLWSNTAAINEVGLVPANGTNFKSGSSFFLYGITKA